jgi:hypothetical protein
VDQFAERYGELPPGARRELYGGRQCTRTVVGVQSGAADQYHYAYEHGDGYEHSRPANKHANLDQQSGAADPYRHPYRHPDGDEYRHTANQYVYRDHQPGTNRYQHTYLYRDGL